MRVVLLSAGLAAMMTFITGCSSKCEAVCSEANACDLTVRATDVDCPSFCSDVESFNERAVQAEQESCDTQFQAHLDCWEQNSSQMCTKEFEGCQETGAAWTACMDAYCDSVAAKEGGVDPNCFIDREDPEAPTAEPALYPF